VPAAVDQKWETAIGYHWQLVLRHGPRLYGLATQPKLNTRNVRKPEVLVFLVEFRNSRASSNQSCNRHLSQVIVFVDYCILSVCQVSPVCARIVEPKSVLSRHSRFALFA
jgi:hypothetical protein